MPNRIMNVHNDQRDANAAATGNGTLGRADDEPPRPSAARGVQSDRAGHGNKEKPGEGRSAVGLLEVEILRDVSYWDSVGPVDDLIAAVASVLEQPVNTQYNGQIPGDEQHSVCLLVEPCAAIVMLSDDERVRKLNLQYRGMDKPTNVLSFPYRPTGPMDADCFDGAEASNLGDIILAAQTVMREAGEQQIPPAHHFQHLVLHGLLHLLGFDHQTLEEAREMEGVETELLGKLGIPDPYAAAVSSGTDQATGTKLTSQ